MNFKSLITNIFFTSLKKKHKRLLGYTVPSNYFHHSREKILNVTSKKDLEKNNSILKVRKMNYWLNRVSYASILLVLVLVIGIGGINLISINIKALNNTNNIVMCSLFIDNNYIEDFIGDFSHNETLKFAKIIIKNMSNTITQSLFINDSELDNYVNNYLIETVNKY